MFIDSIKKKELVIESERLLLYGNKIKFSFDKNWSNNFTKLAGVYAIFCNDDLLYIGESASIKERMKEIKRTINHSFRKKLGKHLYCDAIITNGKFDNEIENSLNEYYITNLYVSFIEIEFGRIEIEEELIKRNKNLLNSISLRSSKYTSS
jgi:hypothetical protein